MEEMKRAAAAAALKLVEPGMRLGLGTGSTARHFVDLLGARVKTGLEVLCVPTSNATHAQAQALGIPLTTLDATPRLDLTVDGADELDLQLRLIKGGGGALLREKIVAKASNRMAVIADASKQVAQLGRFPLPVEVVRFGWPSTRDRVEAAAAQAGARGAIHVRVTASGEPFLTDGGNVILDCSFGQIDAPMALDVGLKAITGVVDHGLFIGIASVAFIATPDGVRTLSANGS